MEYYRELQLLSELIKVYGFKNLMDFETEISAQTLKKLPNFLNKINSFSPKINQLFPINVINLRRTNLKFTTETLALNILKSMLSYCLIPWKTRRTANTVLLSLEPHSLQNRRLNIVSHLNKLPNQRYEEVYEVENLFSQLDKSDETYYFLRNCGVDLICSITLISNDNCGVLFKIPSITIIQKNRKWVLNTNYFYPLGKKNLKTDIYKPFSDIGIILPKDVEINQKVLIELSATKVRFSYNPTQLTLIKFFLTDGLLFDYDYNQYSMLENDQQLTIISDLSLINQPFSNLKTREKEIKSVQKFCKLIPVLNNVIVDPNHVHHGHLPGLCQLSDVSYPEIGVNENIMDTIQFDCLLKTSDTNLQLLKTFPKVYDFLQNMQIQIIKPNSSDSCNYQIYDCGINHSGIYSQNTSLITGPILFHWFFPIVLSRTITLDKEITSLAEKSLGENYRICYDGIFLSSQIRKKYLNALTNAVKT